MKHFLVANMTPAKCRFQNSAMLTFMCFRKPQCSLHLGDKSGLGWVGKHWQVLIIFLQ